MATGSSSGLGSPASSSTSYPKSPKSPRQLPQLPTQLSGQRSPSTGGSIQQLSAMRSPSTPRVFEFPPEFAAETPNTNFDFEDFVRAADSKSSQELTCPRSPSLYGGSSSAGPKSPSLFGGSSSAGAKSPASPGSRAKSPVFQFCKPRRHISKTLSCPPKSPMSPSVSITGTSPTSSKHGCGTPKSAPYLPERRRNSCLSLGPHGLVSANIVSSTSEGRRSPNPADSPSDDSSSSPKSLVGKFQQKQVGSGGSWQRESLKMRSRPSRKGSGHAVGCFNRSQGCLDEAGKKEGSSGAPKKTERNMSRKSTSDLTELNDADTEVTILSSPRRRGSMKGGLAYLASRRGSRDSQASNVSNVSNEDIGPLNFSAHPRGRQRRTSNFLELPGLAVTSNQVSTEVTRY